MYSVNQISAKAKSFNVFSFRYTLLGWCVSEGIGTSWVWLDSRDLYTTQCNEFRIQETVIIPCFNPRLLGIDLSQSQVVTNSATGKEENRGVALSGSQCRLVCFRLARSLLFFSSADFQQRRQCSSLSRISSLCRTDRELLTRWDLGFHSVGVYLPLQISTLHSLDSFREPPSRTLPQWMFKYKVILIIVALNRVEMICWNCLFKT